MGHWKKVLLHILLLFWKVEKTYLIWNIKLNKIVGNDWVFLGLVWLLFGISLKVCPWEIPRSSIFDSVVNQSQPFSKHRPSGPMLSISWNVRLRVCLSVCPSVCSLLRYRLNVFLSQLPEVGGPIFLEIRNPWGKVMERSGLRFEHFCLEVV